MSATLSPVRERGPDFVGVGVQKSGTTWLADVLAQHPGVLLRTKEISFFVRHYHRGWDWYESHFADKGGRRAGELSVNHWYSPREHMTRREFYPAWNPRRRLLFWRRYPSARDELAAHYPGLRVFAAFRDPTERAWSHYRMWRERRERNGKRVVPFERMFADDGRWIRTQGRYAHWLAHWRERFPDFGVFLYDDIRDDPKTLARQVYRFVGADPAFEPVLGRRVNEGRAQEQMPDTIRRELRAFYREEILRFQAQIGRDLSRWLD
jgi:Sulfotransferase family